MQTRIEKAVEVCKNTNLGLSPITIQVMMRVCRKVEKGITEKQVFLITSSKMLCKQVKKCRLFSMFEIGKRTL